MTAFSDSASEFTVQVPDAMEMYDQLRRHREEGMYARLSAMINRPEPLALLASVQERRPAREVSLTADDERGHED